MGQEMKLIRTWYKTDIESSTDEEYVGTFVRNIPNNEGWQMIQVDWSKRGEVEVTWLIP